LTAAAALAAETSGSDAVDRYADEQRDDLGKVRVALDTVGRELRADLGEWLGASPDSLVYPTLRQREQMVQSDNGTYALAQVETREEFGVTRYTKEYAAQLIGSHGSSSNGIWGQ